jgi:hypothetical protein
MEVTRGGKGITILDAVWSGDKFFFISGSILDVTVMLQVSVAALWPTLSCCQFTICHNLCCVSANDSKLFIIGVLLATKLLRQASATAEFS